MLEKLAAAHAAGKLRFFGAHAHLADNKAFGAFLTPLKRTRWFVYSKRPFAGPQAVLAYLSRYTHRVAISNSRLIAADATSVTFKVKDYRIDGPGRYTTMKLEVGEFIRRFLLHVLPKGFHRIRHYGLLAGATKAEMIAKARELLLASQPEDLIDDQDAAASTKPCPCCGGRMVVIEIFQAGCQPQHPPINTCRHMHPQQVRRCGALARSRATRKGSEVTPSISGFLWICVDCWRVDPRLVRRELRPLAKAAVLDEWRFKC
jgi:Putative transposase